MMEKMVYKGICVKYGPSPLVLTRDNNESFGTRIDELSDALNSMANQNTRNPYDVSLTNT